MLYRVEYEITNSLKRFTVIEYVFNFVGLEYLSLFVKNFILNFIRLNITQSIFSIFQIIN